MQRRKFLQASLSTLAAASLSPRAFAASKETRRILYVLGQLSHAKLESIQATVETIGNSGFNMVILSFLQASISGKKVTLLYNGNEFPGLNSHVPALLGKLRSGFDARKRILLSIGGWQNLSTFAAIRSVGVPAFVRRITEEVIVPFGLDGIDLDLEPDTGGLDQWRGAHTEYGTTLVELTNEYKRLHPTHIVTHAPISVLASELYANPTALPGAPQGILVATRTGARNNIDWLNVQFYEGGLVGGGDIAEYYRDSLAVPLLNIQSKTGIHSPLSFFTPLFQPEAKQPLPWCRQTIADIDRRCSNLHAGALDGVAIWDYRQIARSLPTWSAGLRSALQPSRGK